ncbi:hypothetical protein [Pseudomonas sp. RL_15y_Pfl2_60]|uniref:hypothetical protein n=1 Tax=Pseudomonas sp. RL_15y_Pfl2_60 TaxID=3088709 RepID=UPI0030DD628B
MDVFLIFVVSIAAVAAFVMNVRRTNAKGRELGHRPKPLTEAQRRALKLKERKTNTGDLPRSISVPKSSPRQSRANTRAISAGWSIGEVAFTYEDSSGDISYRTVTVHSVSTTHLKGECHEKQAERTFRLERVIGDLTECKTGEILSPKKWARRYV